MLLEIGFNEFFRDDLAHFIRLDVRFVIDSIVEQAELHAPLIDVMVDLPDNEFRRRTLRELVEMRQPKDILRLLQRIE